MVYVLKLSWNVDNGMGACIDCRHAKEDEKVPG